MSLGFGFALPAYPLRGGGGNNPFNQTGPTLDLAFAGVVTNLSDPNGYTLNTNFITPQYQIAAQYVVWETGVGLVDKTFSQIITFSRASGATWFNSAGVLQGVDFSVTSNTIGTGSKTFTLDATAGVNRYWAAGDTVLISDQSNSSNNMTGTVTSYTASTQVLVVNVTSTGGSGTIASWRIGSTMPRFDYDPATLAAQGFLVEESRTNSIRNNTMQGAVAGTPGTAPTNWAVTTTGGSITRTIVGTGTENGITYIDIQYVFSAGATATVQFEQGTQIAAANGQTWTQSTYVKLVGGSLTNISEIRGSIAENNAGGTFLAGSTTAFTPTTGALSGQRYTHTRTLNNASTAFVVGTTQIVASGAADITLRIGLPQLEQGAFATSVIPTTTTALTRSADVASVNTLSPWFNATEGTLFAESSVNYTVPGTSFPLAASLNDNSSNNRIEVGYLTSVVAGFEVSTGGTPQAGLYPANVSQIRKTAGAYATNDFAVSTNGSAASVDTSGSVPTITRLALGTRTTGGTVIHLRRVTYYPRRLSNAELQAITA